MGSVLAIVGIVALGVGLGALLLWGIGLPPTRPRPRSRNRGEPYVSVHKRFTRKR